MSWAALKDPRTWLVAGALLATLIAAMAPRINIMRDTYDVLAVVDITTSMNTRDVASGAAPISRLDSAKSALRALLANLPCKSRLGLGIFTERRTFLLFDPVEVCDNFAAIDEAIGQLEWRMAWEGDSYVAKGLYSAIEIANSLDADLIFLTDGHEMPPLPYSGLPPFVDKPGEVGGLLVGVGSHTHSPLLRYDDDGREVGTYDEQDVPQENRAGPPPPDAESRPGYHPKWAPFGNAIVNTNQHMAYVREAHLKELAAVTGLHYVYLGTAPGLIQPLVTAAHPRPVEAATDVGPLIAGFGLALLAAVYLVGLIARWAGRPSFA